MDKTWKYWKSTIFVWYENSHWRLLGAQTTNTERASLTPILKKCFHNNVTSRAITTSKFNLSKKMLHIRIEILMTNVQ